ncbi:sensor histidine kinase [Caviibacterium pharyngocola]|uniref:histidine kinase n=1 Tax=Caviibacterium pharyngocola TaxID=28159 RepID=A0A2M8RTL9_9PAST|nr:ATP-binding protein [Caviibacterium pharyngocola]PJG82204.1 hypothetical protein CVP04_10505 [Caviibacterium pharyngocola]
MKRIIELNLVNHFNLRKASIAINGKKIAGEIVENPICIKCNSKECLKLPKAGEFVCSNKISSYHVEYSNLTISTFGHLGEKSTLKQGHYAYKSISKLKLKQFQSIVTEQLEIIKSEIDKIELNVKTSILNSFHDASKWARQISINAENLLSKVEGSSTADKFKNAPSGLKSVYKCSTLLNDSLQAYEIFINPENVDFGSKKDTQIYQLFDKFQAILYNSEAKSINKSFKLEGNSHSVVSVYQSFTTIPLSLLHNAMKYSMGNEKIKISFTEILGKAIIVNVISNGPYISDDEKTKIFEKNFRGKYASRLHHDGLGIGLYVANIVAKKHNSTISVSSNALGYERDGIPIAENTFTLRINL